MARTRSPGVAAKLAAFCLLPLTAYSQSPPALPPAGTNCTDASSKLASWDIRDFTFDTDSRFDFGPGTAGKVSFSIKNSANGYKFNCLQGSGETGRTPNHFLRDGKVWYSCNVFCMGAQGQPDEADPPLTTWFHFDLAKKALSVSQSWSCGLGGNGTSTNYTGTGTSVVTDMSCRQIPDGRPDQVACSPVDVTIKASNVSTGPPLVESAPDGPIEDQNVPIGVPTGGNPFSFVPSTPGIQHNTPGCSKMSQSPSWKVSEFYYSDVGVGFSLTNNALNYTQRCSLIDLSSDAESRLRRRTAWNCTRFDPMHVNYPSDGVYTTIYYGGPQHVIGVNQTWYCDDDGAANATVYSAYAEAKFPIKCNETRSCTQAAEYQSAPFKIVQDICNADDVTFTTAKSYTLRVPKEQAVENFKPHGYNCSSRSLGTSGAPAWQVSGFSFNRTWVTGDAKAKEPSGFQDMAEFYYTNTATNSDWPMNTGDRMCSNQGNPGGTLFDGTEQMSCSSFSFQDPEFKFSYNTSTLTLVQEWRCDGIDRQHTNYFGATGSVHLNLHCTSVGNETQCMSMDKVSVPMANLTSNLNSME